MKKEVLIDAMPMAYAVGTMYINGELYYLAGSEHRDGKISLIHPESKEHFEIAESVGGVMALIGAEENTFLSIEGFYPVFDSAGAAIYHTTVSGTPERRTVERKKLFDLPYTHRIGLMRTSDGLFLVSGTLCKDKQYRDDWSTKGSVYVCSYEAGSVGPLINIYDQQITKHHGMWTEPLDDGTDAIYVTGTEGVFRVTYESGSWGVEQVLDRPTSDVIVGDLVGDGSEAVAIIEEFHGDLVKAFTLQGEALQPMASLATTFGHVLYYAKIDDKPLILLGERGGADKGLWRLSLVRDDQGTHFTKELIDSGGAPAQLIVVERADVVELVVTNHGENQVVRYQFV